MEQEAATIVEATTGEPVYALEPSDMPALACDVCEGDASFDYDNRLDASQCVNVTSGSCEEIWIALHPDEYKNDDGILAVKSLFCVRCPANLELIQRPDGQIEVKVCDSICGVDEAGEKFRKSGMEDLNKGLPSREEMLRQKKERKDSEKAAQEAAAARGETHNENDPEEDGG